MSMAQNPKVMRKLSEKLGPLYQKAGMGGPAAPQATPTQVKLCSKLCTTCPCVQAVVILHVPGTCSMQLEGSLECISNEELR